MSERDRYPAGVPCWVETTQPDPEAAAEFYAALFGWDFAEAGEYLVAQIDGRAVAGIGPAPTPSWNTYVRVDDADAAVARATIAGGGVLAGPIDALPSGRLAVMADPTGAVICVWEAHEREGAQLVNEPNTWTMSALHSPDPATASSFYSAMFGWLPEPFGPATLLRLRDHVGGEPAQPVPRDVVAVMAPADASVPPHWNVNFRVSGADATVELAASLGGTVVMPPVDTPGFRSAAIADPGGAVFSVSQFVG